MVLPYFARLGVFALGVRLIRLNQAVSRKDAKAQSLAKAKQATTVIFHTFRFPAIMTIVVGSFHKPIAVTRTRSHTSNNKRPSHAISQTRTPRKSQRAFAQSQQGARREIGVPDCL